MVIYKKNTINKIVFYFFLDFNIDPKGPKGPPGRVRSRFRRWKTGVLQLPTCGAHGLRTAQTLGKTDVLQLQTCGDMSKLYLPDSLMP